MRLRSPVTGASLRRDAHYLVAGEERWPVIDEIAFLRADRRALADAALAFLDDGDVEAATVLLLGDQDGWAPGPPPDEAARRRVVQDRATLSFRDAMELLAFGGVGTYFAHRWSDPTFLSGLALAQAHWPRPDRVLEVACGAGHFLRAFAPHAAEAVGGDIVFAKLWLARHFVAPDAGLVCFDAAFGWPFEDRAADLLFCHDAFYFLSDKKLAAAEMMRVAPRVLVGHVHNALVENLSAGAPVAPRELATLFPGGVLFDDAEMTRALIEARVPSASQDTDLSQAAAITIAWGNMPAGPADGMLTQPKPGARLRRNPLYQNGEIRWPSDRYAREYGDLATYPSHTDAPERAVFGADDAVAALARTRVLLDLPERW